ADMRQYITRLLSEHWTVIPAMDGLAVLELATREQPDLVISDVMMPGLDGFALLRELRADPRTRAVPIILLSARAGEESRVEGLDAGADDYLVKPFSARTLVARVGATLAMARVRRESEAAVRASEERYRAFIEQTAEAVWRCEVREPIPVTLSEDEQIDRMYAGAVLAECNDAMARQYGYEKAGELVGAELKDLLPRSDPANVEYQRAFIRAGYRLADAESHEVDREGRSHHFLNNLLGIVEDGRLVRAWGSQRDVTERKQAEQELRESEARFRTMADTAPVMIWISDADNLLTWFNRPWLDFTGRRLEDELGDGWIEGVHPDDVERVRRTDAVAFAAQRPLVLEYRLRRRDGTYRWVLDNGVPRYHPDA
ncbi:MAG: PAS domain S-box protein, partial [Nocardioidaceae bacterium]